MTKLASGLKPLAAVAALLCGLNSSAMADDYPSRPIRLIIPYAAGGATDVLGRALAHVMSKDIKQTIVIENKGGAQGAIAAQATARAAPDGYTLFVPSSSLLVINPLVYKKLSYDPVNDFRLLSILAENPIALVVSPSLRVKTIAELIEYAQKNPGKLNFGSGGVGTATHLAGEMLKYASGIEMTHIPFGGTNPAVTSLLGNQIDLMFVDVPTALPHIEAGTLRALAVASHDRLKMLPQTPTMVESGYKDFIASVWFGVAAPARIPDDVAALIKASMDRALDNEEFRAALKKLGFVIDHRRTPQEIDRLVESERARWSKVLSAQKISIE